MATKVDKYYQLLIELSQTDLQNKLPHIKECLILIENFNVAELNYSITSTVLAWNANCKYYFIKFLEEIFKRGGDPNCCDEEETPAIFRATLHQDNELIDIFIKWGGNIFSKAKFEEYELNIIEWIVFRCIRENNQVPKAIIKHLLNLGASTDLTSVRKYIQGEGYNIFSIPLLIYKNAKYLVKLYTVERERDLLKTEIKDARDYILELECRPPELGGPEYEATRKRWEARVPAKKSK